MQGLNYPSKQDSYDQITNHLLNADTPLNYSLEYLLGNYGDRAVPALMQALPFRPWYEQQIILDTLGKIGDIRAIVPICALIYDESKTLKVSESSLTTTLRNLLYYTPDRKKAIQIMLDTMIKYRACCNILSAVLKEQNDKYSLKMVYKKLFKNELSHLKDLAITIISEQNRNTEYRIKFLKKMHFRLKGSPLRDLTTAALQVLLSKKKCKCLCQKKGMKFDAFFRRPDNDAYDCCCIDKTNKRVLIKFEGGIAVRQSGADK